MTSGFISAKKPSSAGDCYAFGRSVVAAKLFPINHTLSDCASLGGHVSRHLWVISLILHNLSFPTFPIMLAPSHHHYMQSYEAAGGLENDSQGALDALLLQSPSLLHLVQLQAGSLAGPSKRECFRHFLTSNTILIISESPAGLVLAVGG